jgi:hypothetical protein
MQIAACERPSREQLHALCITKFVMESGSALPGAIHSEFKWPASL